MPKQDLSYVHVAGTVARAKVVCTCGWESGVFNVGPFDPAEALAAYQVEHLVCLETRPISSEFKMFVFDFIKKKMESYETRPKMHAFTKDGYACLLGALLDLYRYVDPKEDRRSESFHIAIFGVKGSNVATGLADEINPAWCTKAIFEVKKRMPELY